MADQSKICSKCGIEYPATTEFFNKGVGGKLGLRAYCKICHNNYSRIYQEKHKEERSTYKKKHKADPKNKKLRNEHDRNRRKSDIQFRLSNNVRSCLRNAIKRGWKTGKTIDDLGCEIEYLKDHFRNLFQSGMSWDNWGRGGWEIDHIKPLLLFDLTDSVQRREACHYTNLQPLWVKQNLFKGPRYKKENHEETI